MEPTVKTAVPSLAAIMAIANRQPVARAIEPLEAAEPTQMPEALRPKPAKSMNRKCGGCSRANRQDGKK